ncbi:MAG TPA: hypothetical protein VGL46_09470 [Pseudonocardiaceae bacterium]
MSGPPTRPPCVCFWTFNLFCYGDGDTPEDHARYEMLHQLIRAGHARAAAAGDVFVLAVQELVARDPDDPASRPHRGRPIRHWFRARPDKARLAGHRLAQLAEATGLRYQYAPNKPAVGVGTKRFHTGLLWDEQITPAGGFITLPGTGPWDSMSMVGLDLDVGARTPVKHASHHAPADGMNLRADGAERVLKAMTDARGYRPGVLGQDGNSTSADWIPLHKLDTEHGEADTWVQYEPDPYLINPVTGEPVRWRRSFANQCTVTRDREGHRTWQADRRPGEVLFEGGLYDSAAALRMLPWQPTVGHWPGDLDGPRRLDITRITKEVVPALISCEVISTAPIPTIPISVIRQQRSIDPKKASDHLAFETCYNPAMISRECTI